MVRVLFFLTTLHLSMAARALELSPQKIVDLVLSQGLESKSEELTAQKAYVPLEEFNGRFDWTFLAQYSWERSEAESLSGASNPEDKTQTYLLGFSKAFITGTQTKLTYNRIFQESRLSAFAANNREPEMAMDFAELELRQNLWRNAFGFADRRAAAWNEMGVYRAKLTREENLEKLILDTMELFWNAYTAQEELRLNIAAREKYDKLVKNTRAKTRFNLVSPGELPRLESEFELTDQRVKSSSAQYLLRVDELLAKLNLPKGQDVTFKFENHIPPLPQLKAVDIKKLRQMESYESYKQSMQLNREAQLNLTRPQLDLVVKASNTGVEDTQNRSFSEMVSGTHPTYYLGVEFSTPLDSATNRAKRASAEIDYQLAELNLRITEVNLSIALADAERKVVMANGVAESSQKLVGLRERVVKEVEVGYRQGRQPLVELIRSYNELFEAQLQNANKIGQYHKTLNALAAVRDELIVNQNREGK